MAKRHTRPTQQLPQGGIIEKEMPLHVSNVQLICPKCGKSTRVAHKILASGQKNRACKKCGEIMDKEKIISLARNIFPDIIPVRDDLYRGELKISGKPAGIYYMDVSGQVPHNQLNE